MSPVRPTGCGETSMATPWFITSMTLLLRYHFEFKTWPEKGEARSPPGELISMALAGPLTAPLSQSLPSIREKHIPKPLVKTLLKNSSRDLSPSFAPNGLQQSAKLNRSWWFRGEGSSRMGIIWNYWSKEDFL